MMCHMLDSKAHCSAAVWESSSYFTSRAGIRALLKWLFVGGELQLGKYHVLLCVITLPRSGTSRTQESSSNPHLLNTGCKTYSQFQETLVSVREGSGTRNRSSCSDQYHWITSLIAFQGPPLTLKIVYTC